MERNGMAINKEKENLDCVMIFFVLFHKLLLQREKKFYHSFFFLGCLYYFIFFFFVGYINNLMGNISYMVNIKLVMFQVVIQDIYYYYC